MNAKEKALYARYKSTPTYINTLFDVYAQPSSAKVSAYSYCKALYYEKNGYGFKVTSAGRFFFSIGFLYDTVNEETGEVITHCHYDTGRNVYDFIVPLEEA